MAGILDLDDVAETVELSKGRKVDVYGLDLEDIIYLVRNFEPVRLLLEKRLSEITAEVVMNCGPDTVGSIIIFGTREGKDPKKKAKALEHAKRLRAADQLPILNKVVELTFEGEFGPFLTSLWGLQKSFGGGSQNSQAALDPNDPLAKTSQGSVPAGLQMDDASRKRYRPRRASSKPGSSLSNASGMAVSSTLPAPSAPEAKPAQKSSTPTSAS